MDALAIDLDVSAGRGNGLADRHFAGIDVDGLGRDARDAIPVGPGKIHVLRADFLDFRDGILHGTAGRTDHQTGRTVVDNETLGRIRGHVGRTGDGNRFRIYDSVPVRIDVSRIIACESAFYIARDGRCLDIKKLGGFGLGKRQSGRDGQRPGLRPVGAFVEGSIHVVDGDVPGFGNDVLVRRGGDRRAFGDVALGGERDVVAGDAVARCVDVQRAVGGFQADVPGGRDRLPDAEIASVDDPDVARRVDGNAARKVVLGIRQRDVIADEEGGARRQFPALRDVVPLVRGFERQRARTDVAGIEVVVLLDGDFARRTGLDRPENVVGIFEEDVGRRRIRHFDVDEPRHVGRGVLRHLSRRGDIERSGLDRVENERALRIDDGHVPGLGTGLADDADGGELVSGIVQRHVFAFGDRDSGFAGDGGGAGLRERAFRFERELRRADFGEDEAAFGIDESEILRGTSDGSDPVVRLIERDVGAGLVERQRFRFHRARGLGRVALALEREGIGDNPRIIAVLRQSAVDDHVVRGDFGIGLHDHAAERAAALRHAADDFDGGRLGIAGSVVDDRAQSADGAALLDEVAVDRSDHKRGILAGHGDVAGDRGGGDFAVRLFDRRRGRDASRGDRTAVHIERGRLDFIPGNLAFLQRQGLLRGVDGASSGRGRELGGLRVAADGRVGRERDILAGRVGEDGNRIRAGVERDLAAVRVDGLGDDDGPAGRHGDVPAGRLETGNGSDRSDLESEVVVVERVVDVDDAVGGRRLDGDGAHLRLLAFERSDDESEGVGIDRAGSGNLLRGKLDRCGRDRGVVLDVAVRALGGDVGRSGGRHGSGRQFDGAGGVDDDIAGRRVELARKQQDPPVGMAVDGRVERTVLRRLDLDVRAGHVSVDRDIFLALHRDGSAGRLDRTGEQLRGLVARKRNVSSGGDGSGGVVGGRIGRIAAVVADLDGLAGPGRPKGNGTGRCGDRSGHVDVAAGGHRDVLSRHELGVALDVDELIRGDVDGFIGRKPDAAAGVSDLDGAAGCGDGDVLAGE